MDYQWAAREKNHVRTTKVANTADARADIVEYIEVWYNRQCRHSTLGYLSSHNFEMAHALDKV
jgi:transposase InsO family protein